MDACSALARRDAFEKQSKNQDAVLRQEALGSVPVYLPDNTGEKQARGELGTAHAIKNRIPSEASDSTKRWGGKRNSALRTSSSLSLSQAANIIVAAQFAAAIGMPFNRMVTIHWEHAGIATSAIKIISGLKSGTRFWFRVAAVGAGGQSGWSEQASKTAP